MSTERAALLNMHTRLVLHRWVTFQRRSLLGSTRPGFIRPAIVTGSCRPFSTCWTRWANEKPIQPTTPPVNNNNNNNNTVEEDDIEQLDPKDYPELYSQEEDDQVDTEWFVDHDEQDFVPLWQQRAMGDHLRDRQSLEQISKQLIETGDMSPDLLKQLLEENKMENVNVMDVRGRCDFTDYMIVAESSMGDRFLTNAAELLRTTVRYKGDKVGVLCDIYMFY